MRSEHPAPVKVPAATATFWIAKATTTALGESTSDFLVHTINPVLAVLVGFLVFCAALSAQFRCAGYVPSVYWLAVASVGVFGTMAADVLHVGFGVPYVVSTPLFAVALSAVFIAWRRVEGTLSIHTVTTRRRELFYWLAVVATFAMGTAAGDLTSVTFGFGYFSSGVLFLSLIIATALAYRWFGLGPTTAFWTAYVFTRPLGASWADWVAVSHARGGLDLGPGPVSLVLAIVLVAIVSVLSHRDRSPRTTGRLRTTDTAAR